MRQWLRRVDAADRRLTRRIGRWPRSVADPALTVLTSWANHSGLWFTIAAVLARRHGRTRRAALRAVAAIAAASTSANALAKPLLPRRRPAADALPTWRALPNPPTSSSFPSGHAASAAAFTTAVAMECPPAALVIAPLAATVAYSRVHTGVHWPSDVVAGAALGVAAGWFTRRWWPVRPAGGVTAVAGQAPALPGGAGILLGGNPRSGPPGAQPVVQAADALPDAAVLPLSGLRAGAELTDVLDHDVQAVGVSGGDGSISAAAELAADQDLPLVVLPTGTFNHFARDAGAHTVADAAQAVADGRAVTADLAWVSVDANQPHPFVNTAALGGYPELVRLRRRWQPWWGKWPAMVAALAVTMATARPLTVHIDGVAITVWALFVGNGLYHPRGALVGYRPRLDSGLLDLRYLRADLPLSRTRFALAALGGLLHRSRVCRQHAVSSVRVHVVGGPARLATDGEVRLAGTDFHFTVAAAALSVYGRGPSPG